MNVMHAFPKKSIPSIFVLLALQLTQKSFLLMFELRKTREGKIDFFLLIVLIAKLIK